MIHLYVALPSLLPIAVALIVVALGFFLFAVFLHLRTGNLSDLKNVAPVVEAMMPRPRRKKKSKKR